MRRSRLAVAAMLLAAMTCGALAGCGEQAKIEKPLDSATAEEVAQIAAGDERLTGELSNKTIKWMGTLSYLKISYKEWWKIIWKLALELFVILLIVFIILALI